MAEVDKTYDAIQVRLAERFFLFIQERFPDLMEMVIPNGMISFDIPPTTVDVIIPITLCGGGCHIDVYLEDFYISTWRPNKIEIEFDLNIHGQIDIYGVAFIFRIDCDIPIHMDKNFDFDVDLNVDPQSGLLEIGLSNLDFEIEYDDFDLHCSGLLGTTIEDLQGEMVDMMNEEIQNAFGDIMQKILDTVNCLPCDFYADGCPGGSSCVEGICRQGATCVNAPLGLAGKLDFASLLGMGGAPMEMDMFLAAGQRRDPESDPIVSYESLNLRLIGGAGGTRHPCVGPPGPADAPPNDVPERFDFDDWDDYIPETETDDYDGTEFMIGVEVSDVSLDRMMYGAYNSGALCLAIGTETIDLLTSGAMGLLGVTGLDLLLGEGHNAPVSMKARPTRVPKIDIGANTQTTDPDGNLVMDQPLLYVTLPGMDVDVFTMLASSWIRLFTVNLDIGVELGLAFTPDNKLIVLLDEESIKLENITISNDELLSETPAELAETLPMLIGTLLPTLTETLEPIEIPPLAGFEIEILALKGDMRRPATDFYEYLGLYLDMGLAKDSKGGNQFRDTWAKVAEVNVPYREDMSIRSSGGILYPEVVLEVGTQSEEAAEYSYRLDNGFWSPFKKGPRLTIRSPRLALVGAHTLQVRARTPGQYKTLDDTPTYLTFEIPTPQSRTPVVSMPETGTNLETLSETRLAEYDQELQSEEAGCACGTSSPGAALPSVILFVLMVLLGRRRY
jgi:hypothetical protein